MDAVGRPTDCFAVAQLIVLRHCSRNTDTDPDANTTTETNTATDTNTTADTNTDTGTNTSTYTNATGDTDASSYAWLYEGSLGTKVRVTLPRPPL